MQKQETMDIPYAWLDGGQRAERDMETLRRNGYEPIERDRANHHIQVWSKRRNLFDYYPTTGTIKAYPDANGIDDLLELLESN